MTQFDLKSKSHAKRLGGLWYMMRGFRMVYLGATLALGVAAVAKTASFLLLRTFVDETLVRDQDLIRGIALIAVSFIGFALVEGLFSFFSGKMAAQTAEGVTRRLRDYMYDHIQRLYFMFHDKAQTGDLIQRVTSDISAIQRFFAEQAIELGRVVMMFVINFIALLTIDPRLAVISVLAVPVVSLISFFFFRVIEKKYEELQKQDAVMSTVLQENLSGVRVVKAFARQDYEESKFGGENWKRFEKGRSLLQMHSLYWPLTDIICTVQMLVGYVVGAIMVINGDITLGSYLAYVGMIIWIIFPMRNLGRLIVNASTGLVSYERIMEIVREDREPIMTGTYLPEGDLRGEVAFENVSFEYEAGKRVLHEITFHAKPGESIALLGSTGSGKTTLVSLLPRFYEYTDGLITIDGIELATISRDYLRRNIGIVEQEPFLFSRSIRENIAYGAGRDVTDEEVFRAAKAAAVHEVILSFPQGYETIVGERGVTLSGGQKQRVAIARTLLKNPRILILDDATSSVDMETEAEIRTALDSLMQQRTTFIIAHRVQSVMNADQILVLDKGRVIQHGTHGELVAQEGLYRQIYDLQARVEQDLEKEIASV
jgi:ATP-binding cassette, subfamily B, bacterial